MNRFILIIILLSTLSSVFAQIDSLSIEPQIDTTDTPISLDHRSEESAKTVSIDSLHADSLIVIDTLAEELDTIIGFFNIFKGEPGRAALYSLIVPGGGQFYNKKWVKAPIIIAADALAFGIAIYWTSEYNKFEADYIRFVNGDRDSFSGTRYENTNQTTLINQRNVLRKYRDYSWFAAGIVHLVTVVEAFVDRHLLEFDMDEDLSLELISIKDPYSLTLASVHYTF